jgi:hypothetical protein
MKKMRFFQSRGLLPERKLCGSGHEMKLYFGEQYPFWKCNIRPCRKKVGLRVGTWFDPSKLPFLTILRFMYCWCEELNSVKWCETQLDMGKNTTVDWNNYIREI